MLEAVRSALKQTLTSIEVIVVDDCSTDGSWEALRAEFEHEPRVSVFRTDTNSGGAGAPRNRALDVARGEFVMFLDSDDVLERHACSNLLRAARRTGAGLVMGQTKRDHMADGRTAGWHARLFTERRVVESIEHEPDLAIDTNSVAKLYPLAWLNAEDLRFPEDIHYEDVVFTSRVFSRVHRIAVIPEVVYRWRIYPSDVRESITHQRSTTTNVDFRVEALRRVLGGIDPDQRPALLRRLQLKVLRHDARVYLNDIADGAKKDFAAALVIRLQQMISMVPLDVYDDVDLAERLVFAAVKQGNLSLVKQAMLMVRGKTDLPGSVGAVNDVALWQPATFGSLPLDAEARVLASFKASEIASIPWINWRPQPVLKSLKKRRGGGWVIIGEINDQFGHYRRLTQSTWQLRFFERGGLGRQFVFPVTWHIDEVRPEVVVWRSEVRLAFPADVFDLQRFTVRLYVLHASVVKTNAIQVRKRPAHLQLRRPVEGALSRWMGVRYEPYMTVEKTLAFRPASVQQKREILRKLLRPVSFVMMLPSVGRSNTIPDTGSFGFRLAYWALRHFPLKEQLLVESQMGRSGYDSPAAIADEVQRSLGKRSPRRLNVVSRGSTWGEGQPGAVRRHTWAYVHALAVSRDLVDNQSLPGYFRKRNGQCYVQTWHGIPLKRMGRDEPSVRDGSPDVLASVIKRSSYWDYLTVPSEYFRKVFVPAYGVKAELLPEGTPRNDRLVSQREDVLVAKDRLGLNRSKTTVLYAPTFRDGARGRAQVALDLERWVEAMGDTHQLLIRAHYLNKMTIPKHLREHVVDVAGVLDSNEVMLAADILVTDYSSIMFDFLSVDRPVVLFTYDLDDYMNSTRGTYFDLRQDAPGPLSFDQEDLMNQLHRVGLHDDDAAQRHAFRDKFAGLEPGDAAATTVMTVWGARA